MVPYDDESCVQLSGNTPKFPPKPTPPPAAHTAIAYFLAVMSPSMAVATSAVPTALAASLLFCGLLIRRGSTPPYYLWVVDANPFSYAWAAFMVNQYDQNRNALLGEWVCTGWGVRDECRRCTVCVQGRRQG